MYSLALSPFPFSFSTKIPIQVKMQQVTRIFSVLAAAGLLPAVFAAPAPQMSYRKNTGPVGDVTVLIPTATGISSSLYGPENLLGWQLSTKMANLSWTISVPI
jgi:hypothetical protein